MPSGRKKIFLTKLTDTSTTDKEGVGCLRWEGNKCYKWVKYNQGAGTVAAVASNVCYYYALTGDGVSQGYENSEVTMDLTDAGLAAGVLQAIIAHASYGWIQIKGPATVTTAFKAGADHDAVTADGASTDGTLDVAAAATDHVCGYATDISAKMMACDFPF